MASTLALSHYQIADLLGRGASGNVYRALNFLTGETVAIKSISVESLPASSLPDLMSEIDLLKNLNHPNIVKYKGFAQDKESLYIVLEYCENGSLQTILKKFGKFPEGLIAVYISQVLEGLVYLHEQGVIHRDIKGANILTNKDGKVKLADFGVSSRAPTPDLASSSDPDADNEVVGSPYWMAPEVIEQSGATTASDIWSVGCVVVELLEGKPPYGTLAPMQALWRIVQDDAMRIPEGASPIVKDFLYQCFQKDPNLRVTAKKLLRHPWMQTARKNLSDSASESGTLPRTKASTANASDTSSAASGVRSRPPLHDPTSPRKDGTTVKSKRPVTQYAEVIQRVQEWNEALNASPKTGGTMRRIPAVPNKRRADESRARADSVGAADIPFISSAPAVAVGLLQKNQQVTDVLTSARESSEAEKWDDDFAFDVTIPIIQPRKIVQPFEDTFADHESDHETLRPTTNSTKQKVAGSAPKRLTGIVEDYSDLGADDDQLELKVANMKLRDKENKQNGKIRLMRPNDIQRLGSIGQSSPAPLAAPGPPPPPRAALPANPSPTNSTRTPPGSRNSSLRGRKAAAAENPELQKYAEAEDEDFSDMFGEPATSAADGPNSMGSLQLTRRSNRSWQDEDEEEVDPFAEFDDFELVDLEANIHQNKRAALWSSVEKFVDQLSVGTSMSTLKAVCDELLNMFETAPSDMALERHFVQVHGMLAVLEVLESRLSRDVSVRLLKIVNFIVAFDLDNLESFCLVGGIPVIIPYTSRKHAVEIRLEASTFIQHLTQSPLTLQMFISCRGLKILVELLDEDYMCNKPLILSALEGIGSVFDLQGPTPKPDFCRMFTREGVLDPLSTALLAVVQDEEIVDDTVRRAVDVLLLFSQVAQGDDHVRSAFGTRTIMMRLLKSLDFLPRKQLVTAIKAVKHLATNPKLIEVLQNSNAMEELVELLGKSLKGSYSNEICSHIFQTIYSMCRLSKARQEEAAAAGIIPLLKRTIVNKSQLKQFALPVLCDLANAGKVARRVLWQNDGLFLYLDLLDDPYWRISAIEAVLSWLWEDPARVEEFLLQKKAVDSLSKCFAQASNVSFTRIVDPYWKIFRQSPALAVAVASSPFMRRLTDALEKPADAVHKLGLLRILRFLFENHPERETVVARYRLDVTVEKLMKQDSAVLVRELAKEVYGILVPGTSSEDDEPTLTGDITPTTPAPPSMQVKRVVSVRRPGSSASSDSARNGSGASRPVSRLRVPSALGPPPPKDGHSMTSSAASSARSTSSEVRKAKRPISRTQLRDVQWEADENGRLRSVQSPLRPKHSTAAPHTDSRSRRGAGDDLN